TGGGDDARAQRTAELHCREAGGARGRVDEQRLTAAQRGAMDERAPCGQIREAEGRALLVGHELRQGVDVALIHRDRLRVAAPREGCEHALPESDLGHAGAHVAHDPRHFEARAEGELRPVLIGAPHEEDVGKGAADRADVDDDLARLRPGHSSRSSLNTSSSTSSAAAAVAERGPLRKSPISPRGSPSPIRFKTFSTPSKLRRISTVPEWITKASSRASSPSLKMMSP